MPQDQSMDGSDHAVVPSVTFFPLIRSASQRGPETTPTESGQLTGALNPGAVPGRLGSVCKPFQRGGR
jgi:hypothetical protein